MLYVGQPGFLQRPTGAGLRCRMFLEALRRAGTVEVFEPPRDTRLGRVVCRVRPGLAGTRASRRARSAFRAKLREPFDLVWFSNLHTFASFGADVPGRTAVDVARVESLNLEREIAWEGPANPETKNMERDRRRWRRVERRCVALADFVTICNNIDRAALAPAASAVVPTGYAEPACRRVDADLHHPPVLVLQGSLYLKQNATAALYAIRQVLPRVRTACPEAQLRIVGPGPARLVEELNGHDGVVATGYVEDITNELVGADIALAPILHGGGIHVKVIESFAHQLPVVITPLGAEGIDPEPGREALVAKDADDFGNRCVELLEDPQLRHDLALAGLRLYRARFELDAVEEQIAAIARRVARPENSF